MTMNSGQRFLLTSGLLGIFTLSSIGFLLFYGLPRLQKTRATVDSLRASIVVANERRNNLQELVSETNNLADQQKKIDSEIWAFVNEDKFFQVWPVIAQERKVTIPDPVVSDATPGPNPVVRITTITISGPTNAVLAAIEDIQALQPTVAIASSTLAPGSSNGQTVVTIQATTLWR